jgi:demethylspheroidene O-methyltransferase
VSIRDALLAFKTALIARPGFQRAAIANPFLRPIARRRARALFDLSAGFIHAQTVNAFVALDMGTRLAEGPQTLDDLARACGLPAEGARCLVVAAEGLGLVARLSDGRVALGETGAALLANPGAIAMARHHAILYRDLADPVALLKAGEGGALANFWAYGDGTAAAAYSELMAASQPLVAAQALHAYPFRRHRRLLDVGGGEGAFLEAVGAAHPGLNLSLFDLPPVAARARNRLGSRAEVHEGSFLEDPLPGGADLLSLVRILHDHDDAPAARILGRCHAALPAGGRLLIVEPLAGTPGAESVGTYFSLYLKAMGSGRPRTAREYGAMLEAAGFAEVREHRVALPMIARVLSARRH